MKSFFLISCEFYSDLRDVLFRMCNIINEYFNFLSDKDKLIFIMENEKLQILLANV